MDIDGMGEAVIDQLVGANLIHNYADLYKLTVGRPAPAGPDGPEKCPESHPCHTTKQEQTLR